MKRKIPWSAIFSYGYWVVKLVFLVVLWFYLRARWRHHRSVVIKSVSLRPNLDFTAMHAINTRNKKGLFLKNPLNIVSARDSH